MTPLLPPAPPSESEILALIPEPNGSPPPSRSAAISAVATRSNPSSSPRQALSDNRSGRRSRRMFVILSAFAVVAVVFAAAAVYSATAGFGGWFATTRPDLLPHTVQAEYLPVTVVERGTLESTDNRDVVCRVKAGSRGTFASTIKWAAALALVAVPLLIALVMRGLSS